jgi:ubiquinone/menaquinone biosynthesis C-methylase UbiE
MKHNNGAVWEDIYSNGKSINRVPYTEVLTFIARMFKGEYVNKKILEIGCGVGNNLLFASWEYGFDVYGIDISSTAIQVAKDNFHTKGIKYSVLSVGDAMSLEFDNNYFDAVIERGGSLQCSTFDKGKKIVEEVYSVLKKNGYFYTTITSQDHNGKYLGNGAFKNDDHDGIRQFYSNHQILELLSKNFKIIEWRKLEDYNVLKNTRTATIHHIGSQKKEKKNE